MRIRSSAGTLIAARQSRMSPTVTSAPVRSRNFSDTSAPCHEALAACAAIDSTEFDKIVASRKPSCRTMRRDRSSSEMPPRFASASGESATSNNRGSRDSIIVIVDVLIVDLVPGRDKGKNYGRRGRNCSDKLELSDDGEPT